MDFLTASLLGETQRAESVLGKLLYVVPESLWVKKCAENQELDFRLALLESGSSKLQVERARVSERCGESGITIELVCGHCGQQSKTWAESLFSSELFVCGHCSEPGLISVQQLAPLLIGQIDKRAARVLELCELVKCGR